MIYVPYWSATMEKIGVDNIAFLCDADRRFRFPFRVFDEGGRHRNLKYRYPHAGASFPGKRRHERHPPIFSIISSNLLKNHLIYLKK